MAGDGGWVLVGPGSEWLWSIVGNAVLIVTLVGLYLQLRAERASRVFEQVHALGEEWNARPFQLQRLRALIELEGRPVEDGMPREATFVMAWFDRLGLMVRKGHVPVEDVAGMFDETVLAWWTITRPYLEHDRAVHRAPAHLRDVDVLAARIRQVWEADMQRPYEFMGTIADRIDSLDGSLRAELDLEKGVLPQRRATADPAQ